MKKVCKGCLEWIQNDDYLNWQLTYKHKILCTHRTDGSVALNYIANEREFEGQLLTAYIETRYLENKEMSLCTMTMNNRERYCVSKRSDLGDWTVSTKYESDWEHIVKFYDIWRGAIEEMFNDLFRNNDENAKIYNKQITEYLEWVNKNEIPETEERE